MHHANPIIYFTQNLFCSFYFHAFLTLTLHRLVYVQCVRLWHPQNTTLKISLCTCSTFKCTLKLQLIEHAVVFGLTKMMLHNLIIFFSEPEKSSRSFESVDLFTIIYRYSLPFSLSRSQIVIDGNSFVCTSYTLTHKLQFQFKSFNKRIHNESRCDKLSN